MCESAHLSARELGRMNSVHIDFLSQLRAQDRGRFDDCQNGRNESVESKIERVLHVRQERIALHLHVHFVGNCLEEEPHQRNAIAD